MENLDQLISQLGKDLEQGKKPSLSSDPILSFLDSYKKEFDQDEKISVPSSTLWKSIENQTQAVSAPIFSLSMMKYVATAALIIVGLVFAYSTFVQTASVSLLASSQESYKTVQVGQEAEVVLRSYSSISEIENTDDTYALSLIGEAQFLVKKRKEKIFKVKTPQVLVEVLGTTFTVKTDSIGTLIYLAEGKIQVRTILGKEQILLPNEALRITANGSIEQIQNVNSELFTAWINHEIVLNSRTAKDVIRELEHHYALKINYSEDSIQTLSGVVKLGSKEQVLKDIGLVLGGVFKKETETSYSWHKRE